MKVAWFAEDLNNDNKASDVIFVGFNGLFAGLSGLTSLVPRPTRAVRANRATSQRLGTEREVLDQLDG